MTLGAIIKLLRTAGGMSQKGLADAVGVTPAYLSQLESDRRVPSIELARTLAKALGVPLAFLLIDEADSNREGFDKLREILGQVILARMERKDGAR